VLVLGTLADMAPSVVIATPILLLPGRLCAASWFASNAWLIPSA